MPNLESTAVFKANIAQLQKEMQSASRAIRLADSEFKKATAGMDDWGASADGLQAKLTQLGTKTDALRKQEEKQKQILAQTVKLYGEDSAAAEREQIALNNIQIKLAKTEAEARKYNQALEDLKNSADDAADGQEKFESATDELTNKIEQQERELDDLKKAYKDALLDDNAESAEEYAREIKELSGELKENKQKLADADKAADELDDSLDDVSDSAEKAGDGFTVMKGVLSNLVTDGIRFALEGLKDLAKQTYEAGSNFEAGMQQVAAISGASGDELEALTAKAKEMGETTKFSATQSAEAFNYMAMAGWDTSDMINGISGIMSLAAASGEDLGTTSDIVTDALTAMGYAAGDAGQLADVMAAASSNANTNVALMGQTFQYAAPIVGALGYNMEDTAVAIGLMANAGIKGQKAGTALRSILTRLSAPPKECADEMDRLGISLTDSFGRMKPLNEIMGDLRVAFSKLSETEQTAAAKHIAGAEAMSGLLSIVNAAPEDFDKLTNAVNNSTGAAETMANTMNDSVSGQITLLRSKIEGIMIRIFEKASGSIRKAINTISKALDKVDWDKVAENVGKAFERLADVFSWLVDHSTAVVGTLKAIATALVVYGAVTTIQKVISAVQGMVSALKAAQSVTEALSTTMSLSPIGLFAAAISALIVVMVEYSKAVQESIEEEYGLTDAQQETIDKIYELSDAYDQMDQKRDEANSAIDAEYGYLQELRDEYNSLIDSNGQVKDGYKMRADFILHELADAMGVEYDQIGQLIDRNGQLGKSIDDVIEKKKAEAYLSANEEAYREAVQKRTEALNTYVDAQRVAEERETEYQRVLAESGDVWEQYNALVASGVDASGFINAHLKEIQGLEESKKARNEANAALKEAERTYVGYNATIQNYEGLSAAVIAGDSKKITSAISDVSNNFITAQTGTKEALTQQVKDFEKNYADLQTAIRQGMPGVTQEQVTAAKTLVDRSRAELAKATVQSVAEGAKASTNFVEAFNKAKNKAQTAGKNLANAAVKGENSSAGGNTTAGITAGGNYAAGITSQQGAAQASGAGLAGAGASGANTGNGSFTSSGGSAATKYATGITNKKSSANAAGKTLASEAKSGAESQNDAMESSGKNFAQGFINGISAKIKAAAAVARTLAITSHSSLASAQKEGSPSKLTYQSGLYFVQGYINGISALESSLVSVVKGLATTAVKTMQSASLDALTDASSSVTASIARTMTDNTSYMLSRMQYENEQKLKDFDSTIEKLEKEREKKLNDLQEKSDASSSESTQKSYKKQMDQVKDQYEDLINTQKKYKEAYQSASSTMISQFTSAVNEYTSAAQKLIDATMKQVTDKYTTRYNNLIDKQTTLATKMKSAADLFNVSGAGVMTVNDLTAQTRAITDYTDKLQSIKSKVSADLFDQITTYDMKEGSAFLDRLLAMSASDLDAYNKAYSAKMEAASKNASAIYKNDFSNAAKDYKSEIDSAFKGIPAQLQDLGTEAMKGFVNGLTKNTDYMDSNVKTFIKGMVDQFKTQLKIKSPSRVMFGIGEFTGQGFDNGLMSMIKQVQNTARGLASAVTSPLTGLTGDLSGIRSGIMSGAGAAGNSVVNNYNLVQNNTSPRALSALETYKARREQIALARAATQGA